MMRLLRERPAAQPLLRRLALKRVRDAAARAYIAEPLPDIRQPLAKAAFLALDFETTGLNPRTDRILSMGFVPVEGGRILLARAHHCIVNVGIPLKGKSVAIHHITDAEAERGCDLRRMMEVLLPAMRGRILLVHHAAVERRFLHAAMRALYGAVLPFYVVDTMELERRRLMRANPHVKPADLRLAACRARHGLPPHRPHHALEDAIATAELFLAQYPVTDEQFARLPVSRLLS
jgi:DNA polymerase-3 subunit epsilon